MKNKDTAPKEGKITRHPFPNSKKIYVSGKVHPNIKVAMREISLSDTKHSMTGKMTPNAPVTVLILELLPFLRMVFISPQDSKNFIH